ASPPIPSASTKRFSGEAIRKQSSLLVRTMPTCVAPPLEICKYTPPGGGQRNFRNEPDGFSKFKLSEQFKGRKAVSPTDYSLLGNRVSLVGHSGGRLESVLVVIHGSPSVAVTLCADWL